MTRSRASNTSYRAKAAADVVVVAVAVVAAAAVSYKNTFQLILNHLQHSPRPIQRFLKLFFLRPRRLDFQRRRPHNDRIRCAPGLRRILRRWR